MEIELRLETLLVDARVALAALNTNDRTVAGLVNRIAGLRYAEGTLVGFLDALLVTEPDAAQVVAPKIQGFIAEAIAARLLLD